MAERFAKNPIGTRSGTSVKVDVSFDWFGGKNKGAPLSPNYGQPQRTSWEMITPEMERKAKEFWANLTKEQA